MDWSDWIGSLFGGSGEPIPYSDKPQSFAGLGNESQGVFAGQQVSPESGMAATSYTPEEGAPSGYRIGQQTLPQLPETGYRDMSQYANLGNVQQLLAGGGVSMNPYQQYDQPATAAYQPGGAANQYMRGLLF